jgi:hypothetical protein
MALVYILFLQVDPLMALGVIAAYMFLCDFLCSCILCIHTRFPPGVVEFIPQVIIQSLVSVQTVEEILQHLSLPISLVPLTTKDGKRLLSYRSQHYMIIRVDRVYNLPERTASKALTGI